MTMPTHSGLAQSNLIKPVRAGSPHLRGIAASMGYKPRWLTFRQFSGYFPPLDPTGSHGTGRERTPPRCTLATRAFALRSRSAAL